MGNMATDASSSTCGAGGSLRSWRAPPHVEAACGMLEEPARCEYVPRRHGRKATIKASLSPPNLPASQAAMPRVSFCPDPPRRDLLPFTGRALLVPPESSLFRKGPSLAQAGVGSLGNGPKIDVGPTRASSTSKFGATRGGEGQVVGTADLVMISESCPNS